MTPFEAYLSAMAGFLVVAAGVTYTIYRQKRRHNKIGTKMRQEINR